MARFTRGCVVVALSLVAGCGGSKAKSGCADPLFIDDLEDGDSLICAADPRRGAWFVAGDGTSTDLSPGDEFTATLIPGERDGSHYAARMTGSGFTGWGARMGVSLDRGVWTDDAGVEGITPYDASAVSGVRFWMKSDVPLDVTFPIARTVAVGEPGGTCMDESTAYNCGNHFAFRISAPPPGEWREYEIPFSAILQLHSEVGAELNSLVGSAVWNPGELLGVQFAADASSFDVWIDDLRFYTCAPFACRPICTDPALPVSCRGVEGVVAAACWPEGTDCATVLPLNLYTAWGFGPDDVWAVGYRDAPSDATRVGLVIHWDGSAWSFSAQDLPDWVSGVWGSAPDDVWVGGSNGALYHWNGQSWTAVESGTTRAIYDLWGSGPADVWAVAGAGTILHWDGSRWSSTSTGEPIDVLRVWGSGAEDVWAVGYSPDFLFGSALHWEGAHWSPDVVAGATSDSTGVWGSGPDDVWVVGRQGEIVHWDGSAWACTPSGTTAWLTDVWGSGPNDVWAVGERGTIRRWDGLAWTPSVSGTTQTLFGIWGSGPSDVWITGRGGTILHWDGAAWTRTSTEEVR